MLCGHGRAGALATAAPAEKRGVTGKAVRRRLDPARRAELILEKSLELFAETHYSVVTVRDVAERCGINVGLIYHYFDSKDHLFRSTLEHAVGRLVAEYEARRRDPADPLAGIDAWLETHATIAPMVARMVKVMADYAALGRRDAAVDALVAAFYRREQELLETVLRRGVEAGAFRPVDAAKTARLIGRQLDGIFHASASRGDDRIAADIGELRELVWLLLGVEERAAAYSAAAGRVAGPGEAPRAGASSAAAAGRRTRNQKA
jgi:AcrR family transcriptional regulator